MNDENTTDDDAVNIRCTRIADLPNPPVPSNVANCEMCGAEIWLSHQTVELVDLHHPDKEIMATCMQCTPEGDHQVMHLPEQVRDLRANGVPDLAIAGMLAVAEVAHGLTLEQAIKDMIADPTGVRAMAYKLALERTIVFVRGVK